MKCDICGKITRTKYYENDYLTGKITPARYSYNIKFRICKKCFMEIKTSEKKVTK